MPLSGKISVNVNEKIKPDSTPEIDVEEINEIFATKQA
jgi:hypothetical protein